MTTQEKPSLLRNIATAGTAAVITVNFVHPIDTIKTRLQISGEKGHATAQYANSFQAIKIISQEGGMTAFYKGIQAAWLRESVYTSLRLGAYLN
jgi:D-mannonate dehydratase